ncbi:hypothetical protein K2B99_004607 [Vibrio parahaemolyticus]|uniref:hypothetical protein n=1 Tax=Vibrio parahaemolyticus TaxID=670 RepID=UPI00084B0C9E|nr:hypothetical protein [Vibrio parahaemolyticus]EJG1067240.1 hypothetical protein [Vibrio parahaemolyticus O1]EGR2205568.1 hypothetical protein [Vibrio parahaemolyticus]EHY1001230.1 hypothetical protein [Vibrio parahaemolyticus]EIE5872980.1 hypothetical protein [Vibrio parahaemolyticus]ELA7074237.1 hypothetical protein [Vibrio parahaemolyticus]
MTEYAAILMSHSGCYITNKNNSIRFIPLGHHADFQSAISHACQSLDSVEIYAGILKTNKALRYWVASRRELAEASQQLAKAIRDSEEEEENEADD